MRRYARYKPTGIPWLPEVPEGWETRKIKYLFKERSEKGHPEEPPLCSTQAYGVIPQSLYENRVVTTNKEGLALQKLVKVGDFVISLRAFQGGIEIAHYQGIISAAYTILEPCEPNFAPYFRWLFKAQPFIELLKTCVTGIREGQNINYQLLSRKFIPLPPLPEQREIVAFLDEKCGKVDRLVAAKMKESTLLKELKQSMIAEAVTGRMAVESRATRNDRKMRPSGIPWLPEVPVGWEVKRNKACFTNEKRVVGAASADTQLLSLTTRGIKEKDGDNLSGKLPESFDGYQYVVPDDLVMCLFDLDCSAVFSGISRYYGMISPAYRILKCRNVILPCYADLWFRYISQGRKFKQYSKSLRYTLTIDEFGALPIVVPPLAEQREIVAYIETRAAKIDAAVGKLEAEVTALKEYRERLVADVVTGQRKVA